MNLKKVSITISYALRHNPTEFGLTLDEYGFCSINDLLKGLEKNKRGITIEQLKEIVNSDSKGRYEIKGDMIRAVYGHSAKKITKENVQSPKILYHGTTPWAWKKIQFEGLTKQNREFVNTSEDIPTAIAVGKRRTDSPILIEIKALEAFNSGIKFHKENKGIWSSEDIPVKYLKQIKY